MADTDRDGRGDALRVTYSERVRHGRAANGTYPFAVAGYRIRSIGLASGRDVVVRLVERRAADTKARPVVRYRRTTSQPVSDGSGNQAVAQRFRGTRSHGIAPPPRLDPKLCKSEIGEGATAASAATAARAAAAPAARAPRSSRSARRTSVTSGSTLTFGEPGRGGAGGIGAAALGRPGATGTAAKTLAVESN
jgi:hypothetical protein